MCSNLKQIHRYKNSLKTGDTYKKFVTGFTLVEVLIVVLLLGILATVAIPELQKAVIKAKMSELYITVSIIERGEATYNAKNDVYVALPWTETQADIDNFEDVLEIDMPGVDSVFEYSVSLEWNEDGWWMAVIWVGVRKNMGWGVLCKKGVEAGAVWEINMDHPWSEYIRVSPWQPWVPFGFGIILSR